MHPLSSVCIGRDAVLWKHGQDAYEDWSKRIARADSLKSYQMEIESVRDVYSAIPIRGRCLDVGGHQGRLRAYLSPGPEYMIVDPYLNVFSGIEEQPNLLSVYPFLRNPVNFVCGVAEHLPLRTKSFDCIHKRSVIDHFQNPALALLEAYRVLRDDGSLVIGSYVEGGRTGRLSGREFVKEAIRSVLTGMGFKRWMDHHVWHPTYTELIDLIQKCGFDIEHTHWQKGFNDRVCYIKARRNIPAPRP